MTPEAMERASGQFSQLLETTALWAPCLGQIEG